MSIADQFRPVVERRRAVFLRGRGTEVVALFVPVAGAALRVVLTGHDVLLQLLHDNILLAVKFLSEANAGCRKTMKPGNALVRESKSKLYRESLAKERWAKDRWPKETLA
ncbi:MAG TPA: hypothetical protein VHX39_36800 [Acetobacteraceae bacterium]|nr:hypothetical protein [Acetobacteraceae bacterium]